MVDSFQATEVIDLSLALEFANVVRSGPLISTDPVPRFIYRGVGDATYQLIPTALRTDQLSRQNFVKLANVTTPNPNLAISFGQAIAEFGILRLFYQIADRHGLVLPHLDPFTHNSLLESIGDMPFTKSRLEELSRGWPMEEFRPILALAQHHGLPTRMLDWSIDPLVGCYFAAERGVAHLERSEKSTGKHQLPSHIGVWQTMPHILTHISEGDSNMTRLNVVHAPRGGNENLTAQQGVFTIHADSPGMKVEETDHRSLNQIVHEMVENPTPRYPRVLENYKERTGDQQPFSLFRLPIKQAPTLLSILHRMGYDAARLFPGFGGIAMSVRNLGRLSGFPVSLF